MKQLFAFRRTVLLIISIISVAFFAPLVFLWVSYSQHIHQSVNDLPKAKTIVIFGTLVNPNKPPSPLLQERLLAGVIAYERSENPVIVVSNAEVAAQEMARLVEEMGVPTDDILRDESAIKTSDTCRYLSDNNMSEILFVSQSFHLPRIFFLCNKFGVDGEAIAAEYFSESSPSQLGFFQTMKIRSQRHFREAGLIWAEIFGFYESL